MTPALTCSRAGDAVCAPALCDQAHGKHPLLLEPLTQHRPFSAMPWPAQGASVENGCVQLAVLSVHHPCLNCILEWASEICLNQGTKRSARCSAPALNHPAAHPDRLTDTHTHSAASVPLPGAAAPPGNGHCCKHHITPCKKRRVFIGYIL